MLSTGGKGRSGDSRSTSSPHSAKHWQLDARKAVCPAVKTLAPCGPSFQALHRPFAQVLVSPLPQRPHEEVQLRCSQSKERFRLICEDNDGTFNENCSPPRLPPIQSTVVHSEDKQGPDCSSVFEHLGPACRIPRARVEDCTGRIPIALGVDDFHLFSAVLLQACRTRQQHATCAIVLFVCSCCEASRLSRDSGRNVLETLADLFENRLGKLTQLQRVVLSVLWSIVLDYSQDRGTGVSVSESGNGTQQSVRHHAQDPHGVTTIRSSPFVCVWMARAGTNTVHVLSRWPLNSNFKNIERVATSNT